MTSNLSEHLDKLTTQELQDMYDRHQNILSNKNILRNLPDKGSQLELKFKKIKEELEARTRLKELEGFERLSIHKEYIEHICNMENVSPKERYKPFSTLQSKDIKEKPAQLISLKESLLLLAEQSHKLPVEKVMTDIKEECDSDA